MLIFVILSLSIIFSLGVGARFDCSSTNIHFEKVLGLRPSKGPQLILYARNDGLPVTRECIDKCNKNRECLGFVLYYNTSTCYWYKEKFDGPDELDNILDTSTAWFVKVCLKVNNCDKLWTFERIPGAILIGNDTKVLPNPTSRLECEQHCLAENSFKCRSVKLKIKEHSYGPNGETIGKCILSKADRHLLPNSYRVSAYNEEYFENQCSTTDDFGFQRSFCSYEEFDKVILGHSDLFFQEKTRDECMNLCEKETSFNCRGYSLVPSQKFYNCLLHSEDSKVHGPALLRDTLEGKYFERALCLNISVSCSDTLMTVKYIPENNYKGRMYMLGYADSPQCFALGHGFEPVLLKLPLEVNNCGITEALGPVNRTLMSGTMILQYNNYIQTQGDRIIRVGCIFGNDSKVLLGTGVTVTPQTSNTGSALINNKTTGGSPPMVQMQILDLNTQKEVSDTQIGQELELVIEILPHEGLFDIWAGDLIAMTENGEESLFLLDSKGCPTNLHIFPGLTKIGNPSSRKLVANFQAFKFSSSPIVKFSVMVRFCPEVCPDVDCGNNMKSYGRRKRDLKTRKVETLDGTKISNLNRSSFDNFTFVSQNKTPLEFVMIVRNPRVYSDKLVYDNNKILVAGYNYITNEICLDYSLFVGLLITWVMIQIILVVSCVFLVRRYKKYYKRQVTRQSLEELHKNFGIGFSNLENRRVHWADNGAEYFN